MTKPIFAVRLLGRCANGNEADGGVKYHAKSQSDWSALCGAKPGKRSAGWSDHPDTMKPVAFVNCPKCRRKLERAPSTDGAVK